MKLNKITYLGIIIAVLILNLKSAFSQQNIGINTSGAAPNASALLDVVATDKGVLIPRVALTATNSGSPISPLPGAGESGLLIYNTTTAGTAPNNVVPGFYYWDGTRWVQLAPATNNGGYTNFQIFTNDGTFTVPAGVTRIMVEVWGAGGAGGSSTSWRAAGGGAGGYGKDIFAVVPGTNYNVNIGAGGVQNGGNLAGDNGGNSNCGGLLSATGGDGGSGTTGPIGGAGGTSSAAINVSGGNGGVGLNGTGAHGGHGGGAGGGGGSGGAGGEASNSGDAGNGRAPGGGGGGGGGTGTVAGNGGKGRVIVWW